MAKRASPRAKRTAKPAPTARTTGTKPKNSSKTPPTAKASRESDAATAAKVAAKTKAAKTTKTARAEPALKKTPAKADTPTKIKAPIKSKTVAPAKVPTTSAAKPSAKRPAAAKAPKAIRVEASKKPPKPRYLAAELGQSTDHNGEPVGAGSAKARTDEDLQKYALQLWRQMQSGRVVNRYSRAIERAGFTADEVWTAGLAEMRTTSSTADEIRRYRQKVLFRANLLEAIFTETIADLKRLDSIEPTDAPMRETS